MPMENPVIAFLNKLADLLILNLVFLICCLPVVTIGPAMTAMYHVSLRSIRYGDGYVLKEYIKAFKQDFLQSFVAGIVVLAVTALCGIDILFWVKNDMGMFSDMMLVISGCFTFLFFIITLWLFPVLAKLENKLITNVKNAAALAIGHFFPYTIICTVITAVFFYLAYTSIAADVIFLLLGFSLLFYVQSFFFYKVFAKYVEEEPIGDDDPLYGKYSEKRDLDVRTDL